MSMSGDGDGGGGGVRRGDIVWVRVQYPRKWWPALVVSSSDDIGILVSFFDHNIDTNPRTCFIEPEVLPFEDAFPSLISPRHNTAPRCETFRALLHSALKLLSQRLLSGLRSRFQKREEEEVIGGSGPRFDPSGVLRFVLEAAVSPWVDPPRLLDAIRVIAQVHAFRAHSSIHHMRLCTEQRQTPPIGGDNNVKQQNTCSSLGQKIHSDSVIQESIASGDCLVEVEGKESKDCNQHVAACSEFNSKVGQQPKSKTHVPVSSTSTSLFMKFPKNFNLPSKEQLIKRFSVFGSIDSSRTRVFCYTGSAKVDFFQHGDAVAACRYAGKMVWFGEANVRFWLDPFEHKRSDSNMPPSASKPMGPPLKSCLKKSSSLKQENRKEHHRLSKITLNLTIKMSAESSMLAYIFLDCFHSCCSKYLDKKYLLFQRLGEALLGICNILLRDQGQEGRFIHWLSNLAHSFLSASPNQRVSLLPASVVGSITHSTVVLFCFGFASGALLSLSTSASSVR